MGQQFDRSDEIPDPLAFLDRLPGMAYRCRWDGDWLLEYVSQGALDLTGYGREDLIGGAQPWSERIHPEDLVGVVKSYRRAVDDRAPFQIRYRLVLPGGGTRRVIDAGRVVSEDGVFPRCVEGYIAQERPDDPLPVEARMQSQPDDAGRVLERARDPYLAVDSRGRIVAWNRASEDAFGWARKEALGRDIAAMLVPADQRIRFQEKFSELVGNPAPQIISAGANLHAARRSGGLFPVELSVWPSECATGVVLNAFVHDLTERRALEQQLAETEQTLERLRREDMLTGLASRRTLDAELTRAVSFSRRWNQALSIVVIEPDATGDPFEAGRFEKLLIALAARLKTSCRVEDLPARLDRSRFSVLLPNTGREQARTAADRLLRRLGEEPLPAAGPVVLHHGLATLEDGEEQGRLVERAIDSLERSRPGRSAPYEAQV